MRVFIRFGHTRLIGGWTFSVMLLGAVSVSGCGVTYWKVHGPPERVQGTRSSRLIRVDFGAEFLAGGMQLALAESVDIRIQHNARLILRLREESSARRESAVFFFLTLGFVPWVRSSERVVRFDLIDRTDGRNLASYRYKFEQRTYLGIVPAVARLFLVDGRPEIGPHGFAAPNERIFDSGILMRRLEEDLMRDRRLTEFETLLASGETFTLGKSIILPFTGPNSAELRASLSIDLKGAALALPEPGSESVRPDFDAAGRLSNARELAKNTVATSLLGAHLHPPNEFGYQQVELRLFDARSGELLWKDTAVFESRRLARFYDIQIQEMVEKIRLAKKLNNR